MQKKDHKHPGYRAVSGIINRGGQPKLAQTEQRGISEGQL